VLKVTVQQTLHISRPIENVWDYTQDWTRRNEWDKSVVEILSIVTVPQTNVRARFRGGMIFDIEYKLNDRPNKTTLAMSSASSKWIIGGGGSWQYTTIENGTKWTQTNSLVLKDHFLTRIFCPLFKYSLRWSTIQAMKRAKKKIES
jgi:hypothetical protein